MNKRLMAFIAVLFLMVTIVFAAQAAATDAQVSFDKDITTFSTGYWQTTAGVYTGVDGCNADAGKIVYLQQEGQYLTQWFQREGNIWDSRTELPPFGYYTLKVWGKRPPNIDHSGLVKIQVAFFNDGVLRGKYNTWVNFSQGGSCNTVYRHITGAIPSLSNEARILVQKVGNDGKSAIIDAFSLWVHTTPQLS